tara:strand:- start:3694 stop:4068 length:375 start_codon:yes stop_codon:yes gene_type:complete
MPTTVPSIRDIPADAVLAQLQANGTVLVYMPGDALPPAPPPGPPAVPQAVTMRQARLALLGAGLLPAVNAALAALPEPQKTAAQITWEYSTEVQRGNGLVPQMAASLGMTPQQIDALFIAAAGL